MKTKILNKLYIALVFISLAMVGAVSCSEDEKLETPYLQISNSNIQVNRLGLAANGNLSTLIINSNRYWVASIIDIEGEGEGDWLQPNLLGGAGQNEITLYLKENLTAASRKATIKIETIDGTSQDITVTQTGLNDKIYFVDENLDLTPSKEIPVNKYLDWNNLGIGGSLFKGRGEGVLVDNSLSSSGYEKASGVNNLYFAQPNSYVVLGSFFTRTDKAFKISFGAMSTEAAFNKGDLILQVSKDNENWVPLNYTRVSAEGKWAKAEVLFHYKDAHKNLYIRFETKKGQTFRVDDITIEENLLKEGELIDFSVFVDDGKPDGFEYFKDDFSWITVGPDFMNNTQDATAEARFDNNTEQLKQDPLQPNALIESGWAWGTDAIYIYMHKGYVKLGTTTKAGVLVSPMFKEIVSPAIVNVKVTFDASIYQAKDGTKDSAQAMIVDVVDGGGGTINDGVTKSIAFPLDTYNNDMKQYSFIIYGATERTQIKFKNYKDGKNRMFVDNVKVVKVVAN